MGRNTFSPCHVRRRRGLRRFQEFDSSGSLLIPVCFALDSTSTAYKDEVFTLGEKAQENALTFLKANGSSATAVGTALTALRKMHKLGKLDQKVALFDEQEASGNVVDPTPPSAIEFIGFRQTYYPDNA
ncbi:hypothetical protein F444_15281 [Phytophthora nicotianae P1976]|uniref:Uncharacterized protein n=1 Tax=Phytophthora nicotianae P1976 TaxID=1317066 RepID=A0A080ZMH2_PHYNI|nr:hypothetical protein F444_15281 [Phytophthora nicotianae P1976]